MPKLRKKVNGKVFVVIVPDQTELARGTLKSILRQANITREDFLRLL
jgi:predicted RNA binding protein YcfA (HicA-like mRNA interferase family)